MSHAISVMKSPDRLRKVCVIGLGYIGLPTAAVLAQHGHDVVGVDVHSNIVDTINRGEIHIHEPGLGELVEEVVKSGTLKASLNPVAADVFFICVPTPIKAEKSPDLSYVEAASQAIRPYLQKGSLVILESTSPPQTTTGVVVPNVVPDGWVVGHDVFVAHCPERVLPGQILREVIENDRIVGGVTPRCTEHTAAFYEEFVTGAVFRTTAVTAETTKLVENAYRDVNIAFANELSMLATELGADAHEIIELANRHPRVNVLTPGPGVGGHCISVDPWFLVHASPERTPLIRCARTVNDSKPEFVVEQISQHASQLQSPKIGCLGLTYKADVDDLRESPSLRIVRDLIAADVGDVVACDPYVKPESVPGVQLVGLVEATRDCDIVVLLTDHTAFKNLPTAVTRGKRVVDTRGIWRGQANQLEHGVGIGRTAADQVTTRVA